MEFPIGVEPRDEFLFSELAKAAHKLVKESSRQSRLPVLF